MTVVMFALSILFFVLSFNHLLVADRPCDRGFNGFLLATSLSGVITHGSKLLA